MMKKDGVHFNYYIVESLVLGLGFFAIYYFSQLLKFQILAVIILVSFYTIMGLVHHAQKHDIKRKIVLEYTLISVLVVALFIFSKSGVL